MTRSGKVTSEWFSRIILQDKGLDILKQNQSFTSNTVKQSSESQKFEDYLMNTPVKKESN